MSLNLSRNALAMERAMGMLLEAERHMDECAFCLLRDVIVSEAQAAEHNRSIVSAKEAITALKDNLARSHEEVTRSLLQAQIQFVMHRNLNSATAGCSTADSVRPERDLSSLMVQGEEDTETTKRLSEDKMSYDGTVGRGGVRRDSE